MRKFSEKVDAVKNLGRLQCGRIYKDAEIRRFDLPRAARALLQCGRIYKDAEINQTEGDSDE